jgi:hypothetical protein
MIDSETIGFQVRVSVLTGSPPVFPGALSFLFLSTIVREYDARSGERFDKKVKKREEK